MANISKITLPDKSTYDLKDAKALPLAGGTVTGTLVLSKQTDAAGNADNSPALIVGGTRTQPHLELDGDEIMAKSNGTTIAPLGINFDGGAVYTGTGGFHTRGGVVGIGTQITDGVVSSGVRMEYDSTNKCLNFNFV